MRRKIGMLAIIMTAALLAGCGKKEEEPVMEIQDIVVEEEAIPDEKTEVVEEVAEEEPEEDEEAPEGKYRSELTGEWIDEALKDQRPIAVMMDNEKTALPHYGVNDLDILYEMVNSMANGRVTRHMGIMKDWEKIEQLGSIRSARPTNFLVAVEYNAILIHDGGPFYIDPYVAWDHTNNISGGFGRFPNGKSAEFTEYVTYEDYKNPSTGKSYPGLKKQLENHKYSKTYTNFYEGEHFKFNSKGVDLSADSKSITAEKISLPFPHNSTKLSYDSDSKTYNYEEYGQTQKDGLDNTVVTFKNVIIQAAETEQFDGEGYMQYHVVGKGDKGYYITEGKAVPITWSKAEFQSITEYKNATTGEPIELNVGKTYIAIVPLDAWNDVKVN